MAAFIELDHDRAHRRGYPEAVYCEGKTPDQVSAAARAVKASGTTALFTRASPAHAKAILLVLPEARYDEDAHLLAWPPARRLRAAVKSWWSRPAPPTSASPARPS